MGRRGDRVQSVFEYLIAAILILGGISLLFADPVSVAGYEWLSGRIASVIYFLWLSGTGSFLLQAKLRKKRRQHKHGLLAVYLSTIFIFLLELFLLGWTWYLLDSVIIFFLSGYFWLRFKLRTEYINMDEIRQMRHELNGHAHAP